METKQLTVYVDRESANKAERILDNCGLDIQLGISIFLKRIIKEGGIAFLLKNNVPVENSQKILSNVNECSSIDVTGDSYEGRTMTNQVSGFRRNNSEITEGMRDYVWSVFVDNRYLSYSEYQRLAQDVSLKTGMNQGSAYIYFVILSCFMEGKFNTRTMKFADLVYYLRRILQECTKIEFTATLKSLELSIPYWSEHLQGNFSVKVQKLVDQYKSLVKE